VPDLHLSFFYPINHPLPPLSFVAHLFFLVSTSSFPPLFSSNAPLFLLLALVVPAVNVSNLVRTFLFFSGSVPTGPFFSLSFFFYFLPLSTQRFQIYFPAHLFFYPSMDCGYKFLLHCFFSLGVGLFFPCSPSCWEVFNLLCVLPPPSFLGTFPLVMDFHLHCVL